MTSLRSIALGAVSVTILLGAVGCSEEHKLQIAELHAQYNEVSNQNQELRTELAHARTREADLLSEVDAKQLELSIKNQEIILLQTKLAGAGTHAPAPTQQLKAGNWDVGKYADKVTIGSDILFASGKATLTAVGKKTLDKIIRDLKIRYPNQSVRVYGYTDSDPIKRSKKFWADNLDLSANRAMAVTRYLKTSGIDAETIETIAMGATHFVEKNDTRTNKARNRRVEIVVVKE